MALRPDLPDRRRTIPGIFYAVCFLSRLLRGLFPNRKCQIVQNIQYLTQSSDANAAALLAELPTVSVRMAMAIAGVLPVLVIYPFVQNNFVKGITLGGVKG